VAEQDPEPDVEDLGAETKEQEDPEARGVDRGADRPVAESGPRAEKTNLVP
jgi:hypothetical protein